MVSFNRKERTEGRERRERESTREFGLPEDSSVRIVLQILEASERGIGG